MKKHPLTLVLSDCHIQKDTDIGFYSNIRKLINKRKPDNIVLLGDFLDCEAFNPHHKRIEEEGQRYWKDIAAGAAVLRILFDKLKYTPRIVYTLGNHERWVIRACQEKPALHGTLKVEKDLGTQAYNIGVHDYGKFVDIEGVLFTHIPLRVGYKPFKGKYVARKLAGLSTQSLVFGHTHKRTLVEEGKLNNHKVYVLNAGCLYPGTMGYCKESINDIWKGLIFIHYLPNGLFDPEFISMEELL